jgi:putative OPT family oligopeptide transporter
MEKSASYEHKPFIAPDKIIPELTPVPVLLGVVLGIVFGASSLYLALKVGMTVSASIPVAVLSITLFRYFSKLTGLRRATILENNIVQTTGSAGESIAFGVAVTMPALLILGYEMELSRIMLVAVLGGLLGVLMMIPLRYALIVKGHRELAYPEGTACAEVLTAGERGGTSAATVFTGFFFGLIYKILNVGARLWKDTAEHAISWFKGATVAAEVSPELLGVGYIIGPRIACITVAGGLLSSWVLTPMIKLFGDGLVEPLFPGVKLIRDMSPGEIWRNYVLYIGAGAVAAGGIISLFRSLPTIIHGAKAGLGGLKVGTGAIARLRTEVDLPLPIVLIGSAILVLGLWFSPSLHLNFLGAILIVLFGFLFVTVSSRLTGEIGSSSNPISGMTVATLLITSLVFLGLGWVGMEYRVTALSIAAVVCIAASNGGTTSQDLKTGFLVGATPKHQQTSLLIGVLTSAVVIGYTLNFLNDSSTVYSRKAVPAGIVVANVAELTETSTVHDPVYRDDKATYKVLRVFEQQKSGPLAQLQTGKYLVDASTGEVRYKVDPGINGTLSQRDDGSKVDKFEAPKARLMSLIIDGILTQKLPWGLVLLGAAIAILLELCMVPSLPFAVGVYLPLAVSAPIFFGGLVRWLVNRLQAGRKAQSLAEEESGPGILFSSGLIAGGSIAGIVLALFAAKDWGRFIDVGSRIPALLETEITPVLTFALMMGVLYWVATKKRPAV